MITELVLGLSLFLSILWRHLITQLCILGVWPDNGSLTFAHIRTDKTGIVRKQQNPSQNIQLRQSSYFVVL